MNASTLRIDSPGEPPTVDDIWGMLRFASGDESIEDRLSGEVLEDELDLQIGLTE